MKIITKETNEEANVADKTDKIVLLTNIFCFVSMACMLTIIFFA